jgi:hypothetical protein
MACQSWQGLEREFITSGAWLRTNGVGFEMPTAVLKSGGPKRRCIAAKCARVRGTATPIPSAWQLSRSDARHVRLPFTMRSAV